MRVRFRPWVTATLRRSCMRATASRSTRTAGASCRSTSSQIERQVGIASLTKNNMSYLLIGQDADANNNILSNTLTRFEKLDSRWPRARRSEEAVKQAGLPVEAVMETVAEYNKGRARREDRRAGAAVPQ